MKKKFNTNFDNIVKIENLRGEYEIIHDKEYIREIIDNMDYNMKVTTIHKENNNIRNKRRYKTVIDEFYIKGFNIEYNIFIGVDKSSGRFVTVDMEKNNKTINIKTELIIEDDKIVVFIHDDILFQNNTIIILKDSLGREYWFKHYSLSSNTYSINSSKCVYLNNIIEGYFSGSRSIEDKKELIEDYDTVYSYIYIREMYLVNELLIEVESILPYNIPATICILNGINKYILDIYNLELSTLLDEDNSFVDNGSYVEKDEDGTIHLYVCDSTNNFIDDIYITDGYGNHYVIHNYYKLKLIK